MHTCMQVEFKQSALARATIAQHPQHVFLLDSYHQVMVVYGRQSLAAFPPAPDSHLKATITAMRKQRRIVPEVPALPPCHSLYPHCLIQYMY